MGLYRGSTGVKKRSERGYKGNGKKWKLFFRIKGFGFSVPDLALEFWFGGC